ncbi:ABC transporter permease [Longirhabdus pacifica]|uniref:ABC transporter permease n=1 Tax=Longirhabdus pacifica TaxID=2305227 RepID=UPI001F0BF325|nr:ABC transporter permease [Longirhabdus pacifica]
MNNRLKALWLRGWPAFTVVIFLLILWEFSSYIFQLDAWILPSPSMIYDEWLLVGDRVWEHSMTTLKITLIGFTLGIFFGITTAILLHLVPWLNRAFFPLLIISQNIPIIALAPILVIWFGYNLIPHYILITLICYFPITISMITGLQQTEHHYKHLVQMMGASKWETFLKLELPFSTPYIFSGLKISATYSVMGAVIAEWAAGSSNGIAAFMKLSLSSFKTPRVFIGFIVIVVLSFTFYLIINVLQKWIVKWNHTK